MRVQTFVEIDSGRGGIHGQALGAARSGCQTEALHVLLTDPVDHLQAVRVHQNVVELSHCLHDILTFSQAGAQGESRGRIDQASV